MKYLALVLAMLAMSSSAMPAGRKRYVEPEPTPSASPSPLASPVLSGKNIQLLFKEGTTSEKSKLTKTEDFAEKALHSKCVYDFMVSRKLQQTNGLTPKQVMEKLLSSHVQVGVHFYYSNNSTVGYTYPNDPDVYFNRKFHDDYGVRDEASNALHEWSHKPPMSFDHAYRNPSAYSVPYSLNYAVESCCTPQGVCKP